MQDDDAFGVLKGILVERVRFDPRRASTPTVATLPPNAVAIEERVSFVVDESQELEPHFESVGTLVECITSRIATG